MNDAVAVAAGSQVVSRGNGVMGGAGSSPLMEVVASAMLIAVILLVLFAVVELVTIVWRDLFGKR